MPNLHDVERRIKSVKSTRQITSTMKMIASVKVSKSSEALSCSLPYTSSISEMLARVSASKDSSKNELLEQHDHKKTSLIIVVVSDKGMAGGFNSNILRLAQKHLDQNKRDGIKTQIISCGKKAHTYFKFRGIDPVMKSEGTSDAPKFEQAEKIGNYIIEKYLDDSIDSVTLLYNRCKNSMEQTPTEKLILPVTADCLTESVQQMHASMVSFGVSKEKSSVENLSKNSVKLDKSSNDEYSEVFSYEPDESEVLDGLIPMFVDTVIYNALLDSAAGEQVARRVAMQSATDSADEMIETLTRLYNSVRQNAITTELNEIVGGADALSDD